MSERATSADDEGTDFRRRASDDDDDKEVTSVVPYGTYTTTD